VIPSRQMALALPLRAAQGIEDFLISPSNAEAVGWIDRWPDWPNGGLVLFGPAGAGKSHLAGIWRARAEAEKRLASDLRRATAARAVLIEDAEETRDEEALFHLLNHLRHSGGTLLLTATMAPARWEIGLADLASRLAALPAVALGPPDDTLLEGLLIKHFADRQLRVAAEVVRYLAARIPRTHAAARRAAEALDAAALAAGRAPTVPLAAQVIKGMEDQP